MPKASRVGKFRKTASEASAAAPSTPANTPVKAVKDAATVTHDETVGGAASTRETQAATATSTGTDTSNLSRGKRKRLAKREQYLRKERLVLSSLKLKREEEQKTRIDGLDAIKDALQATVKAGIANKEPEEEVKPNLLKTNKSRKLLMQKEVAQMNLVLQHPAFQEDPFATIRQHLTNTLAKDAANQKKEQVVHNRERKENDEKKKAFKKEHGTKKKRNKFKATRSRGK
jgi:hypothetical protein